MLRHQTHPLAAPSRVRRFGHRRFGLTLIEVTASLVILGLGTLTLTPALSTARQDARIPACAAHLNTINVALGNLQQDYPGFYGPLSDSSFNTYQNGVAATWLDVLQELHYLPDRSPGYCPADKRPDYLNAARGQMWAIRYPAALGGGFGMDHSYGLSVPYSTAAPAAPESGWDPDADPDRRVMAADGFWSFLHGLSGYAVSRGTNPTYPYWGGNTVGYRHKMSANLLHRDGHVALATVRPRPVGSQGYIGYVDTSKHFIWRENEHPEVGFSSPMNDLDRNGEPYTAHSSHEYPEFLTPYPDAFPDALNPEKYDRYHPWTVPDIYEYKGWTPPAQSEEGGAQ